MTLLGRRLHPGLLVAALVALAFAAILLLGARDSGAVNNPTGYWKLSLRIDYTSSGTATNSRCYPDPEQTAPTPLSGSATQTITVRTVRPTTVEFHEAPNGVPVAQESLYAKEFRGKVSESRAGTIDSSGEPKGCYGGGPAPKLSCKPKSVLSGLYVNPLGGIRKWRGFTVQLQSSPSGIGCGLTGAQSKLGDPLTIDVAAKPAKLTGKAGRLVLRGSESFKASDAEESTKSSATGKVSWTVTLVRAGGG